MAIIRTGSLIVTSGGTAQNLVLGAVPSYFMMLNETKIAAVTNAVVKAEWFNTMLNGYAIIQTTTTGVPAYSELTSNGFTPFVTDDADLWIPAQAPYNDGTRTPMGKSTNLAVTGISKAANAVITATHSFTTADIGVTWVTFSQVGGMKQINTLRGLVLGVTSTTSFTVNIDTSSFATFVNDGFAIANVITGAPVTTQFGNQIQMTPLYNHGVAGLTLGSSLMVNTNDVWKWIAMYDTSVNG